MSESRFGARLTADGCSFRLWAPAAQHVELLLERGEGRALAMTRQPEGWHSAQVADAVPGTLYRFRIDGKSVVPDPAAAFQPQDVNGPSEVIDQNAYQWQATSWRGRPWHEAVFLETHVGTFTQQGTYRAMIDKLDHLVATGITALELMPLNDFAGRRNWGYDGVLWYAPDSAYGSPDDLKALIDEAHLRGLMVFLDVVYNHFGPEGNYLGLYAPEFFTSGNTPWGKAIDYRVPEVRAFAIENAVYWLGTFRFDGLRLDAVHAIIDSGNPGLLVELSRAVGTLARATERQIHLVVENDDNRASLLAPQIDPPQGKFRAQWNDDYHHAWHVLLTHEQYGYYQDYAANPCNYIVRALTSGFSYQGEASAHRNGQLRGEPSGKLPPTAFVNFLQNHDQIGNRALGDRLDTLVDARAIEAALAVTLLAPMPPMLFMGEEWGARQPFPFFCDFTGDLAAAVRQGRRREFRAVYESPGTAVPDPLDEATFRSAVLAWDGCDTTEGQRRLDLVRSLLAVRRREIIPILAGATFGPQRNESGVLVAACWRMSDGRLLRLLANLSDTALPWPDDTHSGATVIWGDAAADMVQPWAVLWTLGAS